MASEQGALTYAELEVTVKRCAAALLASGVRPGDRVAALLTPRIEFLILYLACSEIGAVWVGLNPRHTLREWRYVLSDTEPVLLCSLRRFEGQDYASDVELLMSHSGSLRQRIFVGGEDSDSFDAWLDEADRRSAAAPAGDAEHPACIVYTSGSTGRPKGAVIDHRGMFLTHRPLAARCPRSDARIISDLPVDHVAGIGFVYTAMLAGGTLVLRERFRPAETLAAIEAGEVNVWLAETTQFTIARHHADDFDLSGLDLVGYTTRPASTTLDWMLEISRDVLCCYGMTETSDIVLITPPGISRESLLRGNVGRPIDGVEVRIADSGSGDIGEFQVRGDCLMREYLGQPDATADAFTADGWLATGDLMRAVGDGSYEFCARMGDTFRSGGYNINPREIEATLEGHPRVLHAAVISVPDETFGAVGHAFVIPTAGEDTPTEADLEAFCRRSLANYKVPKRITIDSELPMTRTEKIDKAALRKRLQATR